jgi:hypothetical protein
MLEQRAIQWFEDIHGTQEYGYYKKDEYMYYVEYRTTEIIKVLVYHICTYSILHLLADRLSLVDPSPHVDLVHQPCRSIKWET